jgi:DNA-directed RNA polymerase subunit D
MVLKAKGPGTVYASDIETKDSKVKPVFQKTVIVKLLKNQDLELEGVMILGKGKEHTKWSPCLCYYKYKPVIEITKSVSNAEELVKVCPLNVFELKNNKLSINKDNLLKCHLCKACVDVSDAVKLTEKDDEFIFYIESWGQLNSKEIAVEALNIFKEQLQDFEKELKGVK